jgi:hypothetical protein
MPYIAQQQREALNPHIRELSDAILEEATEPEAFAGLLNYACTKLALDVVNGPEGEMRYWKIAVLTGVFENIKQEFYRRVAGPYEDLKAGEHGDVYV